MKDFSQLFRTLPVPLDHCRHLLDRLQTVLFLFPQRCCYLHFPQQNTDQCRSHQQQDNIKSHLREKVDIRASPCLILLFCHLGIFTHIRYYLYFRLYTANMSLLNAQVHNDAPGM